MEVLNESNVQPDGPSEVDKPSLVKPIPDNDFGRDLWVLRLEAAAEECVQALFTICHKPSLGY